MTNFAAAKFLIAAALATGIGNACFAASRVPDPSLDTQSREGFQAAFCAGCAAPNALAENPLLHRIWMFPDHGPDYRVQRLPTQMGPLRAAGFMRIEAANGRRGWASAFLISPCHILTNAHVASDIRNSRDWSRPWRSLTFHAGDASTEVGVTRIPGAHGNPRVESCENDWEVLRLHRCVGDELGYLPLHSATDEDYGDFDLVGAGYPQTIDPTKGVLVDPNCSVFGFMGNRSGIPQLTHTCAADNGNSGGPILTREAFPRVLGMYCTEILSQADLTNRRPLRQPRPSFTDGIGNTMVPIRAIYERVKAVIESERDYIRANSRSGMPSFGPRGSRGGAWQVEGTGIPPMPIFDRPQNLLRSQR